MQQNGLKFVMNQTKTHGIFWKSTSFEKAGSLNVTHIHIEYTKFFVLVSSLSLVQFFFFGLYGCDIFCLGKGGGEPKNNQKKKKRDK